jgi:octanoyl-[GcvH]:protein N-octanoyltransferase
MITRPSKETEQESELGMEGQSESGVGERQPFELSHGGFYIHDTSSRTLVGDILFPFAYDELMCRKVGEGAAPVVHLWRHEKALVLGLRDRRLPMAELGMNWLSAQGYQVGVRSSGGAAVPLDPGVLNISLIVPISDGKQNFQTGFELMRQLIATTMQRFGVAIETGEVIGSYCPGTYDLAVDGRKFCGISQRRQHKAFVVQAFVVVEGHAERRGHMVRMFYEMASGEVLDDGLNPVGTPTLDYPHVKPSTMGSLVSLAAGKGVTMRTFIMALMETMQAWGALSGRHPNLPSMQEMQTQAEVLKQRYNGGE